jgi:hypothetical protein
MPTDPMLLGQDAKEPTPAYTMHAHNTQARRQWSLTGMMTMMTTAAHAAACTLLGHALKHAPHTADASLYHTHNLLDCRMQSAVPRIVCAHPQRGLRLLQEDNPAPMPHAHAI